MFEIATFYHFTSIDSPEHAKEEIEARAGDDLLGSILVAPEGVNGTVAGPTGELRSFVAWLVDSFGVPESNVKWATCEEAPFRKLTVRLKKEIVSLGVAGIDPNVRVGEYVSPERWDEVVARDDVLLIDCRNSYEIEVGTFEGAVDPGTESFREFSDWARSLDPVQNPKVAMFCTGGIRCEKASSLMLDLGFEEVLHLQGGILRYLEERGASSSRWRGECFVFDRRVSVDRELRAGSYQMCWACRMPVGAEERSSPLYEEGVSCPACHDTFTDEERAAKRERHRQFLASPG